MKFVIVGILGFLVTAAAAYLYFVPFHEVANNAAVTARQAGAELGTILGLTSPKIQGADADGEGEEAKPKPVPQRTTRSRSSLSASAAKTPEILPSLPAEPIAPMVQDESLSLKTLDSDSFNETRIEVHPSGRRTVIRLKDGEVVDVVDLPE